MHDWNTDGRGNVKAATVIAWKTAGTENCDVLLRIEFSVEPDLANVSALQFRLTTQQSKDVVVACTN
ncbi:hypothetical protein IB270_26395 [Ensifer sp. ENS05]|uniref:hypothetical protein n=1 Tax=Ensifer sp. ENS05 TaxID=2769277 RepID=UPI00177E9287|nr:hypothetical protein [Ensifer sp. ENS05]MBD9596374.1 hypothetical protein [Ensifer sp. ENS05]